MSNIDVLGSKTLLINGKVQGIRSFFFDFAGSKFVALSSLLIIILTTQVDVVNKLIDNNNKKV